MQQQCRTVIADSRIIKLRMASAILKRRRCRKKKVRKYCATTSLQKSSKFYIAIAVTAILGTAELNANLSTEAVPQTDS